MITTTLNRIREHSPCEDELTNLLAGLGKTAADDEPLPFATILAINGLDDALWCCRAEPQHEKEWRLLMVAYARRVEHLIINPKAKNAIDVAERYANGKATDEELYAASAVAMDAASAVARDAAWAAAYAAARDAAWAAASAVAMDAAWAAASAALGDAAWDDGHAGSEDAARDAASAASAASTAWEDERKWQEQEFLRVVTETGASDG